MTLFFQTSNRRFVLKYGATPEKPNKHEHAALGLSKTAFLKWRCQEVRAERDEYRQRRSYLHFIFEKFGYLHEIYIEKLID